MNPITLNFPAVVPLADALSVLKKATGRDWSRNEFLRAVCQQSLPMRAATPNGARAVLPAFGGFVDAGLADVGKRRLAVLLTRHVNDLLVHGQSETLLVALEPDDPDFIAWEAIKMRREVLARASHTVEEWNVKWPDSDWHDGELMGESELARFEAAVQVTDETCRVPRETLVELIEADRARGGQPHSAAAEATLTCPHKVHRLRRNTLDVVIDKAIHAAADDSPQEVYVALRELALEGVPPLLAPTSDGIRFTTDDNEVGHLTKDALRSRLKRRRKGIKG